MPTKLFEVDFPADKLGEELEPVGWVNVNGGDIIDAPVLVVKL